MKKIASQSVFARAAGRLGSVAVAAALFASGCEGPVSAESEERMLESDTAELKNGILYDGKSIWRGTVGLHIWGPVWGEETCSGQVVSRRTIMTAAHCVMHGLLNERGQVPNPGNIWVGAWRGTPQGNRYVLPEQWATATFNPAYLTGLPYDVALITASTDLVNITSGEAGVLAKSTPTNVKMYAFGFGYHEEGENYLDTSGRYGAIFPVYASKALEYYYTSTSTQPQTCKGDSGGPLKSTTSGLLMVYGVDSYHTGPGTYCRPTGHWVTTADNMYWLRGRISGSCLETSTLYSCW